MTSAFRPGRFEEFRESLHSDQAAFGNPAAPITTRDTVEIRNSNLEVRNTCDWA